MPTTRFPRLAVLAAALVGTAAWLIPATLLTSAGPSEATPDPGTPNNPWPEDCDLQVGIVIDRSDSIEIAGTQNPGLVRSGARGMVNALAGTGAEVAVWSFGTLASGYTGPSPFPGAPPGSMIVAGDYPSIGFTPVGTGAGATAVKNTINAIPFTRNFGDPVDPDTRRVGATNWEAGLGHASHGFPGAVAPNGDRPRDADVLIFFSDGNPTIDNGELQAGTNGPGTTDGNVNAALTAANEVKTTGAPTRIIGVGVGDVNPRNLERITAGFPAAEEFEDYWMTDFAGLGDTLFDVATRICGGGLTLRKLAPGAAPGEWVPRPGWPFELDFPQGQPAHLDPPTEALATGPDGTITSHWINPAGGTEVQVREALPEGQRLAGVTCRTDGGPPEAFTSATFSVTVPQNGETVCDVRNYPNAAAIEIEKTAEPSTVEGPQDVTFTVRAHNPDPVEAVFLTEMVDDRFGDLFDPDNPLVHDNTCDDVPAASRALLPASGGSCSFVAHVEPGPDDGPHVDVVTLTGVERLPDGSDGDELEASDDATVTFNPPPGVDLVVTKDDGLETLAPGDETTYALTVENVGAAPATGVVLADHLPDNVRLVEPHDTAESEVDDAISWPEFDLAPGERRTFEVTVAVDEGAEDGDEVMNRTTVTDDGTHGPDLDPSDNEDDDQNLIEVTLRRDPPRIDRDDPGGPGGYLPRTGGDVVKLALVGVTLAALGTVLVVVARRTNPWWWLR